MLNFTAIDFETANEQRNSVCALGMVVVENSQIVRSRYKLIKPPELRFSPYNIVVHGIRPEHVVNEHEFYRYWKSINEDIHGKHIIAHNAGFDISVLCSILDRYKLEYPQADYNCSVKISKRTWKSFKSHSLNTLADKFGFVFKHHHALEDAEICAKIVMKAAKELQVNSIDELNEKLNITSGRIDSAGTYISDRVRR